MNPEFFYAASQRYEKLRRKASSKAYHLNDIHWAYHRIWMRLEKRAFLKRRIGILTGQITPTEWDFKVENNWDSPKIKDDNVDSVKERIEWIEDPEPYFLEVEECLWKVARLDERERDLDPREFDRK